MKTFYRASLAIAFTFFLFGCSASHPTPAEKQDVLDGMAFAQDGLPITGHMEDTYHNFTNSGEFLRRSKFFKTGADYRAVLILDQVRQTATANDTGDHSYEDEAHRYQGHVVVLCSQAWNTLDADLKSIPISPQDFSTIVGDSNATALLHDNPFIKYITP